MIKVEGTFRISPNLMIKGVFSWLGSIQHILTDDLSVCLSLSPHKMLHDQANTSQLHKGSNLGEAFVKQNQKTGQPFIGFGSIHCLAKTAICA